MIRQPIISVLGHVDHGKCVTADTEIVLANGTIRPIKEIYDEFSKQIQPLTTKDGEIIGTSQANINLLSLNEYGKITSKKASHIWKRKTNKIIEVSTNHGSKIKVTPEHPFFSLNSKGDITKVRADKLNEGDFVLVPSKIPSPRITLKKYKQLLLLKLAESPDFLAFIDPTLTKKLRKFARKLPDKSELISNSLTYCFAANRLRVKDIVTLSKGNIPLDKVYDAISSIKFPTTKQRACHNSPKIQLPKTEDQFIDAFYVIGALWGDGTGGNATLSNTDSDLIRIYQKSIKNSFGLKTKTTKQRTTNSITNSGCKTFSEFLIQVFDYPRRNKSHTIVISDILQKAPNKFLASFISGYFDTDGYVSESTGVEVLSMSKDMIQKLSILLQRFGCPVVLSKKKDAHRLKISGNEYLRKFRKEVGFRLERKGIQLEKMLSKATTNRNFDILPISGNTIHNLRVEFGISGMETKIPYQKKYETYQFVSRPFAKSFVEKLQKTVFREKYQIGISEKIKTINVLDKPTSYTTLYEKLKVPHRRLSGHVNFLLSEKIIKKTNDLYTTTAFGKRILSELILISKSPDIVFNHTGKISGIVSSDFVCVQVKKLREIKKEQYVYDFTVPKTHNFIADRYIIHNTSFLDRVRESSVVAREAGGITQHIGATEVPIEVVQKICGNMLAAMKVDVTIPGLLFVDTPGHEAFTNLRKRGGSIADLAVLVVDIREGFMPQTIEALEILKQCKTPFIIIANKIDLLSGWNDTGDYCFSNALTRQQDFIKTQIDTKIYELMGKLSDYGISTDRFDRVENFTKQVSIVPMSAKTGTGVAEALMLLTGLSQKYLEKNLQIEVKGAGQASILEVKEEKGLGTSLDLILYDGTINRGDTVIISGRSGPIETKVKALLKPKPLDEMRDPKDKFDNISSVSAASGLKLVAPKIDDALAGGHAYVVDKNAEELKEKIKKELESVRFKHDKVGVIVRADTLGSLEAILGMLSKMGIPVRKADIGAVTKTDLMEAESIKKETPEYGLVMAFNAPVSAEINQYAKKSKLKILSDKVIYKIIEEYEVWMGDVKRQQEMAIFDTLPFPAEVKFMEGCTFRRSDPAIVGMAVKKGRVRPGYPLMKEDGTKIGKIDSLQEKNEKVDEAKKGDELAVAIDGPLVGRQIEEGDTFYTHITFPQYEQILKRGMKFLNGEDKELLTKIAHIVRNAK